MQNPTIQGGQVLLRPLEMSDAHSLFGSIGSDSEVWEWLPYVVPSEEVDMRNILASILSEVEKGSREAYAIVHIPTDQVIGSTSFLDINQNLQRIEIGGTFIAKKYWRTGVNRESKLLMLSESFEVRGIERAGFKTDNLNLRSQQALTKLGATREGSLRHHVKRKDGSWRDSVYFSILRSEWPQIKSKLSDGIANKPK